jgi:two-component system, NarL family, response regulator LiaR
MNAEKAITVSIVEDDPDFSEGLCFCLNQSPSTRVIGRYSSGREAIQGIQAILPDVTLIDIGLPDISGIDVIKKIHPENKTEFLVLSVYDDDQHIFDALKAGAVGYMLKNDAAIFSEATRAIEDVMQGGAPMSLGIARRVLEEFREKNHQNTSPECLTKRETEILEYLSKGHSARKVAEKLFISYETIRRHQKNIYKKIQVNSLLEAVAVYRGEKKEPFKQTAPWNTDPTCCDKRRKKDSECR